LKLLGRGGFGQVWEVQDLLLNQRVALKISAEDIAEETLVLRRLPKDRYVSVFDYVKDSGVEASAYSMELLERPWMTLDKYQRQHLWPQG
jgi:serine/threonine protein kinase